MHLQFCNCIWRISHHLPKNLCNHLQEKKQRGGQKKELKDESKETAK